MIHIETEFTKRAIELTVLSFGGGQDSTSILYKLVFDPDFRIKYAPNKLLVIMAATGDEHPETDAHVVEIQAFCKKHNIEFIHLTPDMGFHSKGWQNLRAFYNRTKTVGSKVFPKTCTDNLKLKPIYRYLENWLAKNYGTPEGKGKLGFKAFAKKYGKIQMLIGISKGEEKRMADPTKDKFKWRRESIHTVYPLVDLGMDRAACQEYIKSVGYTVPLPSNCILCPFMGDIELLWLYRFRRADYETWVKIEQAKIDNNRHMDNAPVYSWEKGEKRKRPTYDPKTGTWTHPEGKEPVSWGNKNCGVWPTMLLPQKLEQVIKKYGHMTDAELADYKMSHGHCVMSKY